MKATTKRIALDWSQLLGFNQVKNETHQPTSVIGAKVGGKPVSKDSRTLVSAKIGSKVGLKAE